jgi:RNA polymerase sigma-70 factor, ECF subfamily
MIEQIEKEELVGSAMTGDEDALGKLLEQSGARLHAHVARRTNERYRSMVSPEDVLQVTFIEAFLRIKSFIPNGPCSFEAWLFRIADHNLINAIRGLERKKDPPPRKRVDPATGNESYGSLLAGIDGLFTTPSRGVARMEVKPIIDHALSELPEGYEQILRLFDMEGKTAVEVGQIIGKSEAAVYMMAGRARKRLAELLGSSSQYFSK